MRARDGLVGWASCEPTSQTRDVGHPADGTDGGYFVVFDGNGEEFFCAQNDVYGVESHGPG